MRLSAPNFDLQLALNSGQLFNWHAHQGSYYLPHGENLLKLSKQGNTLEFEAFANAGGNESKLLPSASSKAVVQKLFNFHRNYASEVAHLAHHPALEQSIKQCPGLAITKQEPWECLLSFVLTQNSNIPRIRQNILDLSQKYGEKIAVDGAKFSFFPTAQKLAQAKEGDLVKLRLGYRAQYLSSIAKSVSQNGFDLQKVYSQQFPDAKETLMELEGIGPKVADCVLFFGYGFEQAFPIDTWLRQVMQKHYFGGEKGKPATDKKIGEFAEKEFGQKAGIVHEYFFANRQNLV